MFASLIFTGLLQTTSAQYVAYAGADAINAAAPPPPISAQEFIQSGQLPSFNPSYPYNDRGYFVPVYVDEGDELPGDIAQSLVDPSEVPQFVSGGPGLQWVPADQVGTAGQQDQQLQDQQLQNQQPQDQQPQQGEEQARSTEWA